MEYTDDKIKSIITQYKKKRERENKMYHEELKHDENWRVQDFKDKYPEKYMYLENRGYIPIHQNTDTLPENPPGIKDFFDVIDEHTETA